jgi:hypothetical protein
MALVRSVLITLILTVAITGSLIPFIPWYSQLMISGITFVSFLPAIHFYRKHYLDIENKEKLGITGITRKWMGE